MDRLHTKEDSFPRILAYYSAEFLLLTLCIGASLIPFPQNEPCVIYTLSRFFG